MSDLEFGYWLAGFVDGEGCFQIKKLNQGANFGCRFIINLRADDKPILDIIKEYIGYGTVFPPGKGYGGSNPIIRFEVETKEGCEKICDLFSEFPLRAKKRKDFSIWKEAVELWSKMSKSKKHKNDWSGMEARYRDLKAERIYHA